MCYAYVVQAGSAGDGQACPLYSCDIVSGWEKKKIQVYRRNSTGLHCIVLHTWWRPGTCGIRRKVGTGWG